MPARLSIPCVFCLLFATTATVQGQSPSALPAGAPVALLRAPKSAPQPALERRLVKAAIHLGYRPIDPKRAQAGLSGKHTCHSAEHCNLEPLRKELKASALILFRFRGTSRGRTGLVQLRSTRLVDGQAQQRALQVPARTKELKQALARILGARTAQDVVQALAAPPPSVEKQAQTKALAQAAKSHAASGSPDQDSNKANHQDRAKRAAPAANAAPKRTVVVLSTTPPHGKVGIDQGPTRRAPAEFEVAPGPHRVHGQRPGFAPVVQQLDIPRQSRPFEHKITLHQGPVTESAPTAPEPTRAQPMDPRALRPAAHDAPQSSMWNQVLAAALGATSIALTGYAVVEARRDGSCVEESTVHMNCVAEADTEVAVIGAAVGATLTGAAAVGLLIFEPLQFSASSEHAKITIGQHF